MKIWYLIPIIIVIMTLVFTILALPMINCLAKEGRWGRFCMSPVQFCLLPTSDAGKSCTDSDQCESACVVVNDTIPGNCYGWDPMPCGCWSFLHNGTINRICSD